MSEKKKKAISILMIAAMMFCVFSFPTESIFAAGAKVRLKNANKPTTITKGSKYTVKGKIVSSKKMKRVEIGIVKASTNKWTRYKYDNKKLKSKTFKIKKAAKKLKFNKLAAGTYYYRIYAHTSDGVHIVLNKKFKVKKASSKSKQKISVTTTPENILAKTIDTITGEEGDTVELSDYNYPSKFKVGSKYSVKGAIKSSGVIKRVEAGIVVTATNKWTEYKYDNSAVNSNAFDVSTVADALKYEKLPSGKFSYRIYVHTDKGVAILMNREFEITSSGKALGAVSWAGKIAADDSYTYGKGYGQWSQCCVCNNCTKAKDKKFTCMPFLAAAYAHGTGNTDLLSKGSKGWHYMYLNDKNFKGELGEVWFKIGLCKDLTIEDLQPGDVIIKWSDNDSSGHAWMYGGGDVIIEAVPADIRVLDSGAAAKLKRYGTVEGTPKKNYVMRYRG